MLQQVSSGADVSRYLKPGFQHQLDWIRSYVMHATIPKTSHGGSQLTMSGKSFLAYAKEIVDSINSGKAPVIRNAWDLLSEIHCRDAIEEAFKVYQKKMEGALPSNQDELTTFHQAS